MIEPGQKIAIYMEGNALSPVGKMGHGVIRYSPNPVVAVIDSTEAGTDMAAIANLPRSVPVVANLREAADLGADVLVLGIAPSGGAIPPEWFAAIDEAVALGMSVVNGLHERLEPRYPNLPAGQWVWDIRQEPGGLQTGTGAAAKLSNKRLLMIGTDMGIGKMTAGLEIVRGARERGLRAEFVATGQIGITLTGRGVPLDAIRLDFASGAIEREVVRCAEADLVVIEGQGSLIHPASSANLPLLRGSCPTHLVLCHRAGQETLWRVPEVKIPPLLDVIRLYEEVASACDTFPRPKTVGISLNTFHLTSDEEALAACNKIEEETGLPCVDPVRHGVHRFIDALV